jgi:hypothetical protein
LRYSAHMRTINTQVRRLMGLFTELTKENQKTYGHDYRIAKSPYYFLNGIG